MWLGLDIGTSGCKAVVFDDAGAVRARAYREYPVLSAQPGWAQLDSRHVLGECEAVVLEAATSAGAGGVRAMAVCCQGEAFTPLDGHGRPLAHAMVSSDARASSIADDWSQTFGRDRLYQITGHTPHPMFSLFKLLWLKQHEPQVWREAKQFLCFEDLWAHHVGLPPAMAWSLAGRTMLFDPVRHEWSGAILGALELSPDRLARPLPSGERVGQIPLDACRRLGLADHALLVAAGHDQPCSALGGGVTAPGAALYSLGTVECLCPAFAQPVRSATLCRANLCTYDFTLPHMSTTVAFSLTGGNLLRWFRDEWSAMERHEAQAGGGEVYELILRQMPAEPSSVLALPYFTPSGTPHFDTRTPGAVVGLRLHTRRGDVLRGLMEGIALEMRVNLELLSASGIEVRELRAAGGGSGSRALLQLKADVLQRPIHRLAMHDAGCLGAAALACAAAQGADARDVVRQWVREVELIAPQPRWAEHYESRLRQYRALYEAMASLHRA
jgi:xylulokinase